MAAQDFGNKVHSAACFKPDANLCKSRQASKLETSQFDSKIMNAIQVRRNNKKAV